jgi:hypothetical protein
VHLVGFCYKNIPRCKVLWMSYSFIVYSVLRQVYSVFQSEFFTECDLVLPLSIYSILFFLKAMQYLLRLLPRLLVTSIYPSIFPSVTCFRRKFLRKMWPIQLAFFVLFVRYFCPPWICYASFLTWSVQLIVSTLLQHHISNFQGISDLLFEVSKFQHHTQQCSKCSTLPVSSLNLSPICWWKETSDCWLLLLLWQSWSRLYLHAHLLSSKLLQFKMSWRNLCSPEIGVQWVAV